jgi:hypothetical protein
MRHGVELNTYDVGVGRAAFATSPLATEGYRMTKQPHGEPHDVVSSEAMELHRQRQPGFSQRCNHLSSVLLLDYDSVGANTCEPTERALR